MQNIKISNRKKRIILFNKIHTFFSKPQNIILVILGVVCTITTLAPIIAIIIDTISIHVGTADAFLDHKDSGFTLQNYIHLFTSYLAMRNLWIPLFNTIVMAALSCFVSILIGGLLAFLVTRTNMPCKKWVSAVFIFPYIMPQWTLAMVWNNLFESAAVMHTKDGLFSSLFGINMPLWWCQGMFPCVIVLGIHYAPFAYILIGAIFRNMDANLEEAATILNTPKSRIITRVTLPMIKPAILSTVLLVFSSSMGSYPVPHFLKFSTLATRYLEMNAKYAGEASVLAVIMMLIGIAIMLYNQRTIKSRKNYTTVTGKSGQISKINLGRVAKNILAAILVIFTFFISIFPIILFAIDTFLPNKGDYGALRAFDLTLKWWFSKSDLGYGQAGILHNKVIWHAFFGTMIVSISVALLAGTLGTLIGYAVSKNRRSKLASYVNSMAFIPYLMPSIAVGIAFFVLSSNRIFNLYNTYWLIIIVGTIKFIPFASRSSLNSMLQLSGEIEESAMIQNIPWYKRMFKIILPIQKSSIVSGYLLPFMTCLRELSLFLMLCTQGFILSTTLDYFDEMDLFALSSGVNLILIVTILICNAIVNKLTGASLDKGIGG